MLSKTESDSDSANYFKNQKIKEEPNSVKIVPAAIMLNIVE